MVSNCTALRWLTVCALGCLPPRCYASPSTCILYCFVPITGSALECMYVSFTLGKLAHACAITHEYAPVSYTHLMLSCYYYFLLIITAVYCFCVDRRFSPAIGGHLQWQKLLARCLQFHPSDEVETVFFIRSITNMYSALSLSLLFMTSSSKVPLMLCWVLSWLFRTHKSLDMRIVQ